MSCAGVFPPGFTTTHRSSAGVPMSGLGNSYRPVCLVPSGLIAKMILNWPTTEAVEFAAANSLSPAAASGPMALNPRDNVDVMVPFPAMAKEYRPLPDAVAKIRGAGAASVFSSTPLIVAVFHDDPAASGIKPNWLFVPSFAIAYKVAPSDEKAQSCTTLDVPPGNVRT